MLVYTTTMERDRFGADGNANASCSSFPRSFSLDTEGMMDAVEGALHHQICEFLQGPAAVQESLQHAFQEGYFSVPSPYMLESSEPFHFVPGETLPGTLQADSNVSLVEHRLPGNGLHQVLNQGSHTQSPVQRKQFTAGGSAQGGMVVPTSIGSCAPSRQLWSMDQTCHYDRATFPQDVPAQPSREPSFVYAAPDSQACIPNMPREFSSNFFSPNIAADSISFQPRQVQKPKDVLSLQLHRSIKSKRATDQAGHIIRERLRRDDMTSKFLMLESLLPPGPKRDRATIVEHSIQFVKNLHHRVKDLQQKRSEMRKSTKAMSLGPLSGPKQQIRPPDPCQKLATAHPVEIDKIASETNEVAKAASCIEKVEVHLNWPEEIVIEMTCRPHAHIQSQVLGALERLRMDVSQCSICKSHGRILCSIVVRPREIIDPPVTSDDIVGALKRAVVQADS